MPAIFTHLTAVERLAAHVNTLPAEFTRALGEDLEYARFGAALSELPWFGRMSLGLDAWLGKGTPPHFASLFSTRAPVAFGLKAAELVSNGALVGVEAGLAFLAGYVTQVAVARALYRSEGVDVFAAVDQGLDHAREVLTALGSMIRRNSFTARARSKLLELCPEGSPAEVMRSRAA